MQAGMKNKRIRRQGNLSVKPNTATRNKTDMTSEMAMGEKYSLGDFLM